ncbi:hypothetical protein EAG_09483 [Camponotus floridanus]|uniref:Uncharacterized protein n=1 Tax=Camponotus floridanus TaxID=104421 RepID=E2AIL3_CAMFO|nr:hypothetical protein EAG_09483 [Camponotus floridanus]
MPRQGLEKSFVDVGSTVVTPLLSEDPASGYVPELKYSKEPKRSLSGNLVAAQGRMRRCNGNSIRQGKIREMNKSIEKKEMCHPVICSSSSE